MPTPKKGPRFGRDPAHQRLIMANLAASLFEAEATSSPPWPRRRCCARTPRS